ncbi:MAG: sulfatase-like hydrolase/transferase [Acidimicrobiia bacterium]|nr:sulfatase-like hydrolase/transferase [Acidimicrobiia bacterium]
MWAPPTSVAGTRQGGTRHARRAAHRTRLGHLLGALLVLAVVAAGCAGSSESADPPGPEDPVVPTDTTITDTVALDPPPVPVDGPAPVYVLVLDEVSLVDLLHDGALNSTRFPRFAELASRSTWYTNWTIHSGRTIHSVPAMLSGVLPRNALATPEEYPSNAFDLLADAGWAIHGAEHNSWLCRPELCPDRLPYPEVEERQAHEVYEAFEVELLEGDWPQATLHVVHLLFPHTPWQWLPDGTRYGIDDPPNLGSRWAPDPWFSETAGRIEYLWQLGYTDVVVGQWMDAIEARGEWDEALVIVTADHGIELGASRNTRDILDDNHRELVWVPMFVKEPGQRAGRVVDEPRTATELLPIIAEAAGVALPDDVGGHERVVVTDEWPYEEGAPLNFGPVDESARREVSGEVRPGPGWDGLAARAIRAGLPTAIGDRLGTAWSSEVLGGGSGGEALADAGVAYVDALDDVVGSSRGSCGWDVALSGHLDGPPPTPDTYVGLVVDGVLVGASPVLTPWPRAAAHIAERPSFFHVLVDPDDVPTIGSMALVALDDDGEATGVYDVQPTPGRSSRCPTGG